LHHAFFDDLTSKYIYSNLRTVVLTIDDDSIQLIFWLNLSDVWHRKMMRRHHLNTLEFDFFIKHQKVPE